MGNTISGLPQIDWASVQLETHPPAAGKTDFFHTLESAMGKVEEMQAGADQQVADVIQGNGQDLHAAMIAVEKADLSFQLMMQVRNKIVQAYNQISQMPF